MTGRSTTHRSAPLAVVATSVATTADGGPNPLDLDVSTDPGLPSTIAAAMRSRLAPFDVDRFHVDPDAGGEPAVRFADLDGVISVLLVDGWCLDHVVRWAGGRLVAHEPALRRSDDDPPVASATAGLTYPAYVDFRRGADGIAQLSSRGGFLDGAFPALALGEGLVEIPSFRSVFPLLGNAASLAAEAWFEGAR